ncbi:hypothetical protein C9374_008335 [Naegleria lovaniensis]|uniref:ATPase AAA-type core domain-containing protein n=1 Tax=Naegleria lovaniensis TaxID=51637 RepID=A0AA88KFC1_NAELO|nr:uncharacterized protein C9374_008335 [Naegleria lovaniensis]KAG2378192.1 hypothetical protein C9374_008335 [Naegleria lovaniensis]
MSIYKNLAAQYPHPHTIRGYTNDAQCWCFPSRLARVFPKEFNMTLTDQFNLHMIGNEEKEFVLDFSEALVLKCKTYSDNTFIKGIKPNPSVSHRVIVRFFPAAEIEGSCHDLLGIGDKEKTTVRYEESVFVIYPNKKVEALFEWYVDNARSPERGRNLYAYNVKEEYWVRKYQYVGLDQSHVFGLDDKFEMFERDFTIIHKKIDLLHKVGKSCSLNYFLHGPPGVGKSSFARCIATKYNLDIYTANLKDAKHIKDSDAIKSILSPRKMIFKAEPEHVNTGSNGNCCDNDDYDGCEFDKIINPEKHEYVVVLIEDFDRYLNSCNSEEMSNVLNAIDGVEPSDGIIRVFSANNTEDIKLNKAFLSRMNGIWRFDLNSQESILKRIYELFPNNQIRLSKEEDPEQKPVQELYAQKASEFKMALREVTNHLCRYLMDESNGIVEAYKDIERFVHEKEIKVENDAFTINGTDEDKQENGTADSNDTEASSEYETKV